MSGLRLLGATVCGLVLLAVAIVSVGALAYVTLAVFSGGVTR